MWPQERDVSFIEFSILRHTWWHRQILPERCQFPVKHYIFNESCIAISINSSPVGHNGRHFAGGVFGCIFVNETFCILIKILLKFVPKGSVVFFHINLRPRGSLFLRSTLCIQIMKERSQVSNEEHIHTKHFYFEFSKYRSDRKYRHPLTYWYDNVHSNSWKYRSIVQYYLHLCRNIFFFWWKSVTATFGP